MVVREEGPVDSDGKTASGTRVLIVDDQIAFAEALALAIDASPDMACVGIATTLAEGFDLAGSSDPTVALLDVHLPDGDGIEGIGALKQRRPEMNILLVTADTDRGTMARAALSGAAGFLRKSSSVSAILTALRAAREGAMLVDPSTLAAVLHEIGVRPATTAPSRTESLLTAREHEVLNLMGQGSDPATMAKALHISLNTVRSHIKSILAKLDVHSQLEAVVTAHKTGLLQR